MIINIIQSVMVIGVIQSMVIIGITQSIVIIDIIKLVVIIRHLLLGIHGQQTRTDASGKPCHSFRIAAEIETCDQVDSAHYLT